MTATGALIARHVTDLFPTQTSRFDLAQAARRGVIAPLRCVRIPPGPGVRTIAKVPLRRGEVDTEFDQEMLAELLDQLPFNLAIADLYKTRFNGVPGVVYSAGVRHAYNVAEAFRDVGLKAQAVSGETPKRELAEILARYERGDIDVLVNAQLLAEGWNSPRATVCMHLAPTASKRIYQQRVGRVTRRQPGKEAGIVVDFVHPATKHDDPVVTLHSLLDRDVYRGGAIVVGPVRRGRGRRLRVERRVLPVTADENRRIEVFERELWRIAVEHLDYGEQVQWAALAGARVAPAGWRRARAMLHFDQGGELKRTFLLTAVERNKNPQLRLRALQEIAALQGRRGVRPRAGLRRGLAARRQARGRQGRAAGAGREEDRPPRPGQQLDLALREPHARGARGVRRAALARDQAPARAARELLRRGARAQRAPARARRPPAGPAAVAPRCSPPRSRTPPRPARSSTARARGCRASPPRSPASCCATSRRARASARRAAAARRAPAQEVRRGRRGHGAAEAVAAATDVVATPPEEGAEVEAPKRTRSRRRRTEEPVAAAAQADADEAPKRTRSRRAKVVDADTPDTDAEAPAPKRTRSRRAKAAPAEAASPPETSPAEDAPAPKRTRARRTQPAAPDASPGEDAPARPRRAKSASPRGGAEARALPPQDGERRAVGRAGRRGRPPRSSPSRRARVARRQRRRSPPHPNPRAPVAPVRPRRRTAPPARSRRPRRPSGPPSARRADARRATKSPDFDRAHPRRHPAVGPSAPSGRSRPTGQ